MRKITQEAVEAFLSDRPFRKDNTEVRVCCREVELYLNGNKIAVRKAEDCKEVLYISNAGWKSNITKERLNGIPGVRIFQEKGEWYLNGNEWDGSWIKID